MPQNDEDILAAGETRADEKRIRTMQEDLARAREHALPNLPLATPPESSMPSAFSAPMPEPEAPQSSLPPLTPTAPQETPAPPAGLPLAEEIPLQPTLESRGEEILGPGQEFPTMPKAEELSVLSPEERLSFGEEKAETGAVPQPPPARTEPSELPILKPEEMLSFGEEALPKARAGGIGGMTQRIPLKAVAMATGLLLVLGGGGFAAYTLLTREPSPPPATNGAPENGTPPNGFPETPPQPPVPVDVLSSGDTRQFTALQQRDLGNTTRSAIEGPISEDVLVRILVLLDTEVEKRYLDAGQILEALGSPLPLRLSQHLNMQESTFFMFRFQSLQRPGIAVRIKDLPALRAELLAWEPNAESDFNTLLTMLGKRDRASATFLDNSYNGVLVRYLNFSDPSLSIDYAIAESQGLFLLTFSRQSMFAAIDSLPK